MKRLDHILFQVNPDFIAYFDAQPLPGADAGIEPCECFARFLVAQEKEKKDIRRSLDCIEKIIRDGGWNAEQLHRWFFPTLNRVLSEESARFTFAGYLGPLSKVEWDRFQHDEKLPVI